MKKTVLSKQDHDAWKKLRDIWTKKKQALGLTQEAAAYKLDITQGAVSHYLNGLIPLNTDACLAFARLLQVDPTDIRPELKNYFRVSANITNTDKPITSVTNLERRVPILGDTASGRTMLNHESIKYIETPFAAADQYALVISAPLGRLRVGDALCVMPSERIQPGDDVAIKLSSGDFIIGEFVIERDGQIVINALPDMGRSIINRADVEYAHFIGFICAARLIKINDSKEDFKK